MKSTKELEDELLAKNRFIEKKQKNMWLQGSIVLALKITVINYLIFFFLFFSFNGIIISIPLIFFIEAAILYMGGGLIGNSRTSLSLTKAMNYIFKTKFRGDVNSHVVGTQAVLSYSITATVLFIFSAITYYTFEQFVFALIGAN